MNKKEIINNCKILLKAYQNWKLGYMKMPEDENPWFNDNEIEKKLVYFTLPMSLNYQRNSYKLWEWVLQTYNNKNTNKIFNIEYSANLDIDSLRENLIKYKIALQPNKHIVTWNKISKTIYKNWWNIQNLLKECDYDFLKLKNEIQKNHKKWFPYLSWPKIFNYWCYIL